MLQLVIVVCCSCCNGCHLIVCLSGAIQLPALLLLQLQHCRQQQLQQKQQQLKWIKRQQLIYESSAVAEPSQSKPRLAMTADD